MGLALPDLEGEKEGPAGPATDKNINGQKQRRGKTNQGLIGVGKNEPLKKHQRQRVLRVTFVDYFPWRWSAETNSFFRKVEKLRQPLLISTPEFKQNPFQAIRTHAENTLVKHEAAQN